MSDTNTVLSAEPRPPRIIKFEGRTIQVPHDFTDDEIRQVLSAPQAQPIAPVATPRPVLSGVQGAGRSIADTVGLLPDIADMGANALLAGADFVSRKVGGPDISYRFPLASDQIAKTASKVAEAAGVPVLDPHKMSERERFSYNVNRLGGQAALTSGVLAPVAAARAAAGAKRLPQVGDSLLRAYDKAPAAVAATDTAAGAGAGAGLTAAQSAPDHVRDSLGGATGVALDLAGMLAGQVGAATLREGVTRGPSALKARVSGSMPARDIPFDPQSGLPTSNNIADQAASFVQAQAIDPQAAASSIRKGANEFLDLGAPMPTSGALSNDPKFMALERGQRRLTPGEFAGRDVALRDAARDSVETIRPKDTDPRLATAFVQDVADKRISASKDSLKSASASLGAAETDERSLADAFRPYAGRGSEASASLDRRITESGLRPAQRRKNELYEAIDPDRKVMRSVDNLAELATDIEKQVAEIPSALQAEMVPQRLLADIKHMKASGSGEISFGAMNDMRAGLASAALTARRNGQYRLAENLDRFRSVISREGEALAAEGGAVGERAAAASKFYRDEFAPVWNRGPGDEATRFRKDFNTDQFARSTTPPTTTAGRFIGPGVGAQEKSEALARIIGSLANPQDREAATGAVRQYVLSDLTRTIGRDGNIDPQQVARWLNGPSGWRDALSPFPSVRAEVEKTLADVRTGAAKRNVLAAGVERAAAGVKRTEDEIANSALSLVIGREPTKAARAVLESRDPQMAMREIRQTIGGNQKVLPAWERAVTDHLIDKITRVDPGAVSSGERTVDYGKLVKTFDRYRPALAELYLGQPDKMNALQRAQKLLEPLAKQSGPATTAMPTSGGRPDLWNLLEVGLKAHYGVLKGGGVLRTLKIASSLGADEAADAQRLVTRMMFDPELAAHLLTRKVAEVGTPVWNAKLGKLMRRVEVGRNVFGERD